MIKIVRNKSICNGRPTIDSTRLQVYDIISELKEGTTDEEINRILLERGLSKEDASQILDYCGNLVCQEITKPYEKYCSGCILSTLHENYEYKQMDLRKIRDDVYTKGNNIFFLGNKREIEEEEFGRPGWIIAERIRTQFGI